MERSAMRAIRTLAGALTVLALAGCGSMKVQTDYDRDAAFGRLRTYELVDVSPGAGGDAGGDPAFDNPLMEQRIRDYVDAGLASMGYEKPISGAPDFRISYRMVAREAVQTYYGYGGLYGGRGFGHGFGHGGHGGFGGYGPYYSRDVVKCVLVLDVVDSRSNELIWRGWARWIVSENPSPKQLGEDLNKAVLRILDEFPPGRAGIPSPVASA
jgi:hypothetical protein